MRSRGVRFKARGPLDILFRSDQDCFEQGASIVRTLNRWLLAICVVCQTTVSGQDWAKDRLEKSPRHGEWVTIEHGERKVDAFIVYPEVASKAPGVVVIHEIFGLTDWARSVADQLAEAGYIAIAPDLLSGVAAAGAGPNGTPDLEAARRAISGLPPDQITADLNATVDYLARQPACDGNVTVAGFCWGGGQAFRFATNNHDIQAAFVFYGPGPDDPRQIEKIQAPVYGFYGGNDARVNETIPMSKERMQAAGKTFEPVIYEGAGHGFMREGDAPQPQDANRQARDKAWQRWKSLLRDL